MVAIAQLVESRIVIPVVEGSSPSSHPILSADFAGVAKLVDAPDLGSGAFGVRVRVSSPAPPWTQVNGILLDAFFILVYPLISALNNKSSVRFYEIKVPYYL